MAETVRIIGIDPGLRRCGWGIIESNGNRLSFIACGTITPPVEGALADRLVELHVVDTISDEAVRQVLKKTR